MTAYPRVAIWAIPPTLLLIAVTCTHTKPMPVMRLTAEGQKITRSATLAGGIYHLPDEGNDGAILIQGDHILVDFGGAVLDGARPGDAPDQFTGKGVVVTGRRITLRNLKVRGYKVGIHAHDCDGLTIEDVDVSGNYRKRLLSTPQREDGSDWIYPHHNDQHEWMTRYGAGVYVERATGATIRRVRARHGQNGIIIDRVNRSEIYDNDCSFLSGWGLAMWRSSDNIIARNAFDFCVRGYSHGVYNRGQDSAGILMFEQNCNNVIAENSCTHGGDGFFGFAGREALGEAWWEAEVARLRSQTGKDDVDALVKIDDATIARYRRRGNNGNLLYANDFSYAPAHGIEMTFSFDNRFIGNRLVENAICGVWGGYSQDTLIEGNLFEGNGEMAYGMERGGINIEHGRGNLILNNTFSRNKVGVYLWDDDDAGLLRLPWTRANHVGSRDNVIGLNTFHEQPIAIQLRRTLNTVLADNQHSGGGTLLDSEEGCSVSMVHASTLPARPSFSLPPLPGDTRPVGARPHLRGRHNIIMTEWGPYDHESFLVAPVRQSGGKSTTFRVLGPGGQFAIAHVDGNVKVSPMQGTLPAQLTVESSEAGIHPFDLQIDVRRDSATQRLRASGLLLTTTWTVAFYKWEEAQDPRTSEDHWKAIISVDPVETRTLDAIDYNWGGGPVGEKVGADRFATVARTRLEFPNTPSNRWRIRTVSDDGVRVFLDDRLVLSNWTWHGPTEDTADVELTPGAHDLRIEHFEIDGWAVLQVQLEPLP